MHGKTTVRLLATGFCLFAANIFAADTIKIAVIDPFSGPAALQGEMGSRHIQMAVDDINSRGGVLGGARLELVLLDNKSSPQESLVVLKQAIDQDIRLITQGVGSHVAHALTKDVKDFEEMVAKSKRMALRHKIAKAGDRVVVMAGVPFGTPGSTNVLHVVRLTGHELKGYRD